MPFRKTFVVLMGCLGGLAVAMDVMVSRSSGDPFLLFISATIACPGPVVCPVCWRGLLTPWGQCTHPVLYSGGAFGSFERVSRGMNIAQQWTVRIRDLVIGAVAFVFLMGVGNAAACNLKKGAKTVKKPGHAAVLAAVTAAGDRELVGLVQSPADYVVRGKDLPLLENHAIFRVLLDLDHPASFWLASDCAGGNVRVLSGQLDAVHRVLTAEPKALAGDNLVDLFHELYRNRFGRSTVLSAPTPRVERLAGITTLSFAVQLSTQSEKWKVVLPSQSTPTIQKEPLHPPTQEVVR